MNTPIESSLFHQLVQKENSNTDNETGFVSCLSALPKLMVLGPGGRPTPPSSSIFDEFGVLRWDLLTKTQLWSKQTKPPSHEQEGFLLSSHYLYNMSDLVNDYWRNLSIEIFHERYGHIFATFTHEADFVSQIFHEIQTSLQGQPERAVKVTRIVTSWIERMFHSLVLLLRPSSLDNLDNPSANDSEAENPEKSTDSEEQKRSLTFRSLKMKEILSLGVLKEKLGEDRVYLLRLCVGPLHGLNLRNLIWHGFIAPHEFPTYFSGFLFGIMLSLALEWKELFLSVEYQDIFKNMVSKLNFFDPYLLQTSSVLREHLSDYQSLNVKSNFGISSITNKYRNDILQLILKSRLVLPRFETEWIHGLDLMIEERYYEALVIFFPLLEATLRKIYVDVNQIPSFRMTAEPDTLCLSLDIILDNWLDREILIQDVRTRKREASAALLKSDTNVANGNSEIDDNLSEASADSASDLEPVDNEMETTNSYEDGKVSNKIFEQLGPNHSNVILDLLLWADTLGLHKYYRPRDQLAHGSALPSCVSPVNAYHSFLLLVSLLQSYIKEDSLTWCKSTRLSSKDHIFNLANEFVAGYQPCFHRKRATIDQVQSVKTFVADWRAHCSNFVQPIAVHLLKNAIEKEKKPSDFEYEAMVDARFVKLVELKDKLRTAIRSAHSSSEFKNADRTGLFPIKSPISFHCLIQLFHIGRVANSLKSFLTVIREKFESMHDDVVNRRAWKAGRILFSSLLHNIPIFGEFAEVILLLLEEMLSHPDFATTVDMVRSDNRTCNFPVFLCATIDKMKAAASGGGHKKSEEVIHCLLADKPVPPRLLARGEGYRIWMDISGYFSRLEQYKSGKKLETYYIFEEERNKGVKEQRYVSVNSPKQSPHSNRTSFDSEYDLFLMSYGLISMKRF